jgi:hypothetical protein
MTRERLGHTALLLAVGFFIGGISTSMIYENLPKMGSDGCPVNDYGEGVVRFQCVGPVYEAAKLKYLSAHPDLQIIRVTGMSVITENLLGSVTSNEIIGWQVLLSKKAG